MQIRPFAVIALLMSLLSSCGGGSSSTATPGSSGGDPATSQHPSSDAADSTSLPAEDIQLIDDASFETGFQLKSVSTSDAHVVKHLDYDGAAIESDRDIWSMAQWWTPFDFQYAPYSHEEGWHVYQNESRTLRVNTEESALTMQLNSWLEYQERFGGSRTESSQTWSHFLLEQNFSNQPKISELASLRLSFDFEIDEVTLYDEEHYNSSMHAAQFIMYVTIRNTEFSNFFWFGIPLYDNRGLDSNPSYNIDSGFEGATGALIYRMGQRDFLPGGATIGQRHGVDIDLIPYIEEGFVLGATETDSPPLAGWDWSDCYIDYMNIGWELPGSFNIVSTLYGLSLVAEEL